MRGSHGWIKSKNSNKKHATNEGKAGTQQSMDNAENIR